MKLEHLKKAHELTDTLSQLAAFLADFRSRSRQGGGNKTVEISLPADGAWTRVEAPEERLVGWVNDWIDEIKSELTALGIEL